MNSSTRILNRPVVTYRSKVCAIAAQVSTKVSYDSEAGELVLKVRMKTLGLTVISLQAADA
jgi:hypothetical protein